MIKNVIFDMDGVLIDSEKAIRVSCMEMLKEHGVTARHEDFMPFVGMGEDRFIGGVAELYQVEYNTGMKDRAYEIYGQHGREHILVYDGIKELVLELKKKGYRIAVASAADRVKVVINLGCIGLTEADFDAVVTGSDVVNKKPDPEIFLAAAQKIGANPAETMVVEDAVSGCQAARAAGMSCTGVTTSFDAETLKQAGAMYTVCQTRELLDILEKIGD